MEINANSTVQPNANSSNPIALVMDNSNGTTNVYGVNRDGIDGGGSSSHQISQTNNSQEPVTTTTTTMDHTNLKVHSAKHNGSCFRESEKSRLKKVLAKKKHEREIEFTRLQSMCKLDSEANKIANLDWDSLVASLQGRKLTATQVLEAYIAKALEVNTKFNSITDFIPQAHTWAKELDALKEPKGPLHGIPICVKDDTNVEGMDATHGFVKRLYKPAAESAVLVKILQDLGAVPFCKTNVPQTLFTYGSDNPIYGTTKSAINPKLSPGGSSSGTGSLVGSHGAMFGTGTDIGGSLRIPAHFNGVSSIKPTVGRLSDKGVESSLPNLVGMTPAVGIIGQTPAIVASVFQHLADPKRQKSYDPLVYPVSWDTEAFKSTKKLRIGYFTSMPYFPLLGDTEDVVLEAKAALESLGHTLVPFEMPDAFKYMNLFGKFVLADHSRYFKKCWKGEEVAKGAILVWLASKIPVWGQKVIGRLMNSKLLPFLYSSRTSVMFGVGACTSTDLWDAMGDKKELIANMLKEWKRLELDTVLCALMPFPAPPLDVPGLLPTAVCYSCIWNLVDFPAAVTPFGHESGKKIDSYNHEGDIALKEAKKAIKESIGSPIAVQIVGLPFREEVVLRVLQELENFKKNKK